jgi:hypothetical protein
VRSYSFQIDKETISSTNSMTSALRRVADLLGGKDEFLSRAPPAKRSILTG